MKLARLLLFRSLIGIPLLLAVFVSAYLLFFALPNKPGEIICGESCTSQTIAQIESKWELDQPITTQITRFLSGIFVGRTFTPGSVTEQRCPAPCFGMSYQTNEQVSTILAHRIPATLSIAFGAFTIAVILGFLMALTSVYFKDRPIDKVLQFITLGSTSIQVYFVGLVMQYVIVNRLQLLPLPTYSPLSEGIGQWAKGLILPWTSLSILLSGVIARLLRSTMLESLATPYLRSAQGRGVSHHSLISRHSLRASLNPTITQGGLILAELLGGSVVTEYVFNIPGLGTLAASALNNLDLPVILGTIVCGATFIVITNIILDLGYELLDPRMREN